LAGYLTQDFLAYLYRPWIGAVDLLLASIRSKIINSTKYIKTLYPAVEIQELEISLGILPADVEHWHELKSVNVYVNEDNRIYKISNSKA